MIGDPRFHRWCHPKRLVNTAAVVVRVPKHNSRPMVLPLLTESIRQTSESANAHAKAKIASFHHRRADTIRIRIPAHWDHILTPEEERLAKLLTLLIQDFEEKHYHKIKATPLEVLRLLMNSNNLKQADLITIFGSKGITSEVLNGKRPFSKTHIQRLSERFHVSPDLFLEA